MDIKYKWLRMHLQLPWTDLDIFGPDAALQVYLFERERKDNAESTMQCASVVSGEPHHLLQAATTFVLDAVILAAWQQKCHCVEAYLPKLKRVWSIHNKLLFVQMEHWRWRAGQHWLIPPIIFSKVVLKINYQYFNKMRVSVGRYWECNGVQLISRW